MTGTPDIGGRCPNCRVGLLVWLRSAWKCVRCGWNEGCCEGAPQ